ncbi:hypothetical protein AVEN_6348-1 [Araneus ventricosus]|uniref:Uncharacterized protein n=1 Tax=Araneus ventricosus TaxID=182803 RepID=A0A4Y2DIL5_ARAVE|nr:hypothetical protein AVEN_6348-1 [Araneus ventricosus]
MIHSHHLHHCPLRRLAVHSVLTLLIARTRSLSTPHTDNLQDIDPFIGSQSYDSKVFKSSFANQDNFTTHNHYVNFSLSAEQSLASGLTNVSKEWGEYV